MKNTFPITRTVLVEKNISSSNSIKNFLRHQLSGCSIRKFNSAKIDVFFYIKNNQMLLEAQIHNEGIFYLDPIVFGNMTTEKWIEVEFIIESFIFTELFEVDKEMNLRFRLKAGSHIDFVFENSKKII